MANRSRDAANRRDSRTTAPVGAGGGGSINPNILDPVNTDELTPNTGITGQYRVIVPIDITTPELTSLTGNIVNSDGLGNLTVDTPVVLGARTYSEVQMEGLFWHEMPGSGNPDKPVTTGAPDNWYAWIPDWLTDTFWSRFQESVLGTLDDPSLAQNKDYARYLVDTGAVGDWAGQDGKIAMAVPDSAGSGAFHWTFIAPRDGMLVWNDNDSEFLYYNGSNWVNLGDNLVIPMALADLTDVDDALSPSAGEVLGFDGTHWTNVSAGGAHALDSHSDTNLAPGPAKDGYVVSWDDTAGEFVLVAGSGTAGPHTIISAEHTDTTLTGSLAANHKLRYNGSAWTNVLDNLDSLSDVVISGPIAAQVLAYNGTNWINQAVPTPALDSLSNVNTSGKLVGDVIRWDGSNWVDRTLVLDDLGDVVISGPTSGQGLVYNGSAWVNGTISATVTARACCYNGSSGSTTTATASSIYFWRRAEFSTAVLSNSTLRPSSSRFQADVTGKWKFFVSVAITPTLSSWSDTIMDIRKGANGTLTHTGGFGNPTGGTVLNAASYSAHSLNKRTYMEMEVIVQLTAGEHLEVFLWTSNSPGAAPALNISDTLATFHYLGA